MVIKDIMDRVATLYNDADYERVSQTRYINFLDDAFQQLVIARPDSHAKTMVMQLDPGTKQTLPGDMLALIDIYRNMGQDGVTDGPPIWQVNRKDLDYFADWHTAPAVDPTAISEYAYDTKTSKLFWVSPAPGTFTPIFIELAYSYSFPIFSNLTWDRAITQTVPCDDTFVGAIIAYMLYRLYSTDTASAKDKALAESYKADFYNQLGIEYKSVSTLGPRVGDTIVTTPKV
jgi:hypothetical protein